MTSTVETFSWSFGGPLADLSPALAWSILGATGLAGVAWIVIGYRRTLVSLAPRPRATLTALRLMLWALLVLALAGPTRIERTYAQKQTRPLAVVLDRSDSMTAADNRGTRRADDALRRWRALAPAAQKTFGDPRVYVFANDFTGVASTDTSTPSLRTDRTRVFDSLQRTLEVAPAGGWGGVVMLTDGLDTSGADVADSLNQSVRAALAASTPVFSIPGRNRFSGGDFLSLRDLAVPPQVPPRSQFLLELTLESYQAVPRSVPVRLKVGGDWRPTEMVPLAAGRRALTWSAEIAAGEIGSLPLELVVGEGDSAVTTQAEVRIAPPDTTRILYYQGALDWGYRFLADILRRDPAFSVTPIFNLAPTGRRTRPSLPGELADLPTRVEDLNAYDIVILANAAASQFTDEQETALVVWVRNGGVLLFLAPDDDATHGYAGTELERMLPVTFVGDRIVNETDANTKNFREKLSRMGGSNIGVEVEFANTAKGARVTPALSSFAWEPTAGGIIGADTVAASPVFSNFARVERAKPGATVLARHPRAKAPDGHGAILLALQRYGRGQSAVLTSDALWRWKLNQPSKERGAEIFWQNLLGWLARERPRGPRFERSPLTAETGREINLRTIGGKNARLTARLNDGAPVAIPTSGEQNGSRLHTWTPPTPGLWLLALNDDNKRSARHWLVVSDALPAGESSGLPPDESLLQELARRTGGAVLENTPPSAWLPASRESGADLLRERRTPLWHGGLLLAGLLGLYAAELLLRRRWQLL